MPGTAASAYRTDLVGRDHPFSHDDGGWIAAATLLEHAALVPEPDRSRLLAEAIACALEIVGETEYQQAGAREWQNLNRTPSEVLVLLSDQIQTAGALNLAGALLDALVNADRSLDGVQRGRVLAKRARISWKLGLLDEAVERCRHIELLGRRAKSAELTVRASIGFAAIAQMLGNYPEVVKHCRRAARLADKVGLRALSRDAHIGLMIAAGRGRQFDEALAHGWKVYEMSIGDVVDEAEVLQNLGQVLLDAGHAAAARAAFARAVSLQLPARLMLPALGGLALASAASDQSDAVLWAAGQLDRIQQTGIPRYWIASAMLEAAISLATVGHRERAERYRSLALRLAHEHSFHEVAYRAEELDLSSVADELPSSHALDGRSSAITREIARMEPERLPTEAVLVTTST